MQTGRTIVIIITAIALSVTVILAAAWTRQLLRDEPLPEPSAGTMAREECPPQPDAEYYFPAGVFWWPAYPEPARVDASERSNHSAFLRSMNEPSLSCGWMDAEVYRFLYLRSFHGAVLVRFVRTADGATAHAIEMTVQRWTGDGFTVPVIRRRLDTALEQSAWQSLTDAARENGVWNMQTMDGERGDDGSMRIIEARQRRMYKLVVRWSPKDQLRAFGMRLIDLSGLSIPENERQ
jgi:hypothetical protein